jgi:hypothetical protein
VISPETVISPPPAPAPAPEPVAAVFAAVPAAVPAAELPWLFEESPGFKNPFQLPQPFSITKPIKASPLDWLERKVQKAMEDDDQDALVEHLTRLLTTGF